MEEKLSGVPETLLIPLWARAKETEGSDPIIKDYNALRIVEKIDYDFSKFDGGWMTQLGVAIRTKILDNCTKKFVSKNPNGVIINIGCGLDTRFFRVDNEEIKWYELDLPESINLRKKFFTENERYKMIPKSVFDYSWFKDIEDSNKKVLIIVEGLLMYFTEAEVKELINEIGIRFPKAELLFETTTPIVVKLCKKHETAGKLDVVFRWGIRSGKEILQYNKKLKVIDEWNYFDYYKKRWKMIGKLSTIPWFKNNFNNRIIHLKFN